MYRARLILAAAAALLLAFATSLQVTASTNHVDVLRVKGVINPIVSSYIQRGIDQAESDGSAAVVIEIDTPGGLDSSMREIVQRIISAKIPVIVYVSPQGSRAASAGLFILLSGHIAAMAPNTSTGAAHPVGLGDQPMDQTMTEKVTNDAVSYIRGLAIRNGHNADWAESAVRESVSVTDQEALQLNVIDLRADNIESLLPAVNGRTVNLPGGPVTIQSTDWTIQYLDLDPIEQFLYIISDPNIAYILMTIAMTGLFLELSNPGAILPGIVGGIALLLAIFSFGMLPINFVGVLLILFGFLLFIAELKVVSHGMLTIGGMISMVLGSLMLINSSAPYFAISRWVIAAVVLSIASFFFFAVAKVIRIRKKKVVTGLEGLLGDKGVTRSALTPEGTVFAEGELWQAQSVSGQIEKGSPVRIVSVDGLKLWVTQIDE